MTKETSVDMEYNPPDSRSRTVRVGWVILLGTSALLILAGLSWISMLPQMLLENIAEYANLDSKVFMQGTPSAFTIITMIARGYGVGYAALGFMSLLVALEGYRRGSRWTWVIMWVLVAAYALMAGIFFLAGEAAGLSMGIFSIAALSFLGLLLASRGLS